MVAVHGQFQLVDDPANHNASDRLIGRYRRLSSLSAQAHQTKNRYLSWTWPAVGLWGRAWRA